MNGNKDIVGVLVGSATVAAVVVICKLKIVQVKMCRKF